MEPNEAMRRERPTALALGYFDGVHIGHRAVLAAAVNHGAMPAAVTFDSLPSKAGQTLFTRTVKERRLYGMGIQRIFSLRFETCRTQSPERFVQSLKQEMQAAFVCCGCNFHFGKDAKGDAPLLASLCRTEGVETRIVPSVLEDGEVVSSTRIRRLLGEGAIEQANRLLGAPYEFDFPVSVGDGRGRTWGLPTINQIYPAGFVVPRFGVYAARVLVRGKWRAAVTNLGCRPMFRTDTPLAETYIPDFEADLYGQNIPVRLHRLLRGEKTFESVEALVSEIKRNAAQAQALLPDLNQGDERGLVEPRRA